MAAEGGEMSFDAWTMKPGDKVIVMHGGTMRLSAIDRITPSGIVTLKDNTTDKYNRNGRLRGGSGYHVPWLSVPRPDLLAKIKREELQRSIRVAVGEKNIGRFSLESLERIKAAIAAEMLNTEPVETN